MTSLMRDSPPAAITLVQGCSVLDILIKRTLPVLRDSRKMLFSFFHQNSFHLS
jgi:hypothetical protein